MKFNWKSRRSTRSWGETREKTLFAFFPKIIGEKIIWLESYISVQEFKEVSHWVGDPWDGYAYSADEWCETIRRIIPD